MMQQNQFEYNHYELITAELVHISDYKLRYNLKGELNVWIESDETGKRFSSQLTIEGNVYAIRHEPYTKECFILREQLTGRYHFLDHNDCGFWLQNESFFGAKVFKETESQNISNWLIQEEQKIISKSHTDYQPSINY